MEVLLNLRINDLINMMVRGETIEDIPIAVFILTRFTENHWISIMNNGPLYGFTKYDRMRYEAENSKFDCKVIVSAADVAFEFGNTIISFGDKISMTYNGIYVEFVWKPIK